MLAFRLIFRLFRSAARIQRKRMILTVSAIAWGTISIVLLLSFGEGLKRALTAGRRGLGEGIVIIWAGETSKPFAGLPQGRAIRLTPDEVELVRANVPEIGWVCGEMSTRPLLTWGRKSLNKQLIGTQSVYGEIRNHIPRPGGRFINDLDERLKRRVIFLGNDLARDLFGDQEAVGETVLVRETPFTVVGVMEKKRQMGMYGGPDADHAVIPISTFEAMFGRRTLSNLVYKPARPELAGAAKERFLEVLGARFRFDPTDERVFSFWDTLEGEKVMTNVSLGIEMFLGFIGALTLLIGGVGVANIMFAVVKHRTREIGVQMALGARRAWIVGALVVEALALTAIGGVVGITVGAAIVEALAMLQQQAQSEAMEFLGTPVVSLVVAVTTVSLLGLIGLLAGYFPARRAVTVEPAVALRYE